MFNDKIKNVKYLTNLSPHYNHIWIFAVRRKIWDRLKIIFKSQIYYYWYIWILAERRWYGENEGYNAVHKCRPLCCGGGVSIYIQDFLEYYTREDLCYQNSTIESIFIEIDKDQIEKNKYVIIRVVYRPPNSDIYSFNDYMSDILTKITCERKYVSCLGDNSTSLLNYDTHGPTQEFAICCTLTLCH